MGTPAEVIDRLGQGFLEKQAGHLVLHTAGSSYQRGVQHGWLLRRQIQSCFQEAYVNGFFRCSKLFSPQLWYTFSQLNARFFNSCEKDELTGIAHGSGLRFKDILVMNSAQPIEAIYNLIKSGSMAGCTQVVLSNKATASGGMLVGRNLDIINLDILHKYALIQVHKPNDGNAFVTPGFVGKVLDAVTGWNEKGFHVSQDIAELPWENCYGLYSGALIRRLVSSCASIKEAVAMIEQLSKLGGGGKNITLADGKQAVVVEVAQTIRDGARGTKRVSQRSSGECGDAPDVITATNHYLTKRQLEQIDKPSSTSSLTRMKRAQMLIDESYGRHDVESVKSLLMDKLDLVTGQIHGAGRPSDNIINWHGPRITRLGVISIPHDLEIRVSTTISTVSDLARGIMWIALGKKYIDSTADYYPLKVYDELLR